MDSNFRFLVVRPSNRHGRWDCCLENGSGSVGEPKVRIHLPPAGGQQQTGAIFAERPLKTRASRVDGGYRITGRKMFASMLEEADFVLVMAYPDWATSSARVAQAAAPRDGAYPAGQPRPVAPKG